MMSFIFAPAAKNKPNLQNVTFHRKTRLIEHFNLGQTVFQTPSNGVCKAFAKGLQSICKGFGKSLKRF